jgi:putative ABC transport system permease protein
MQTTIETQLGSLGSQTFAIEKMPGAFFGGGRDSMMKFFRRREIDYPQARRFQREADFAPFVGLHANFWTREVSSLDARTTRSRSLRCEKCAPYEQQPWTISGAGSVSTPWQPRPKMHSQ